MEAEQKIIAQNKKDGWVCPNAKKGEPWHIYRCLNCISECGGSLCIDCCSNAYEGYDDDSDSATFEV